MAECEPINDTSHLERFWPLDEGVSCEGCPDCDLASVHYLWGPELDLRLISLNLWTPDDRLARARNSGSCAADCWAERAEFVARRGDRAD